MKTNLKKVKKAVFPVAGLGTRFLPATKAMPKELLPIIDKPLIQYAAEEAVNAGIETLIFVTGRNKRAVEDHFDNNLELEQALISKGKEEQAKLIRNILPENIQCIFVRQPEQLGLGHAVLCAERVVGNEPFAVLLADDFIIPNFKVTTRQLIDAFYETGKSQLSVVTINGPEISNYGVLSVGQSLSEVTGLVEKPAQKSAPSNFASIGRYVLNPSIFDILKHQQPGQGGEIQLSDAINTLAQEQSVQACKLIGVRYDCGTIDGYVDAVIELAKNNER